VFERLFQLRWPDVFQVRTAVSKTLVKLFENDVLGALLEDAPAQKDAYNRSVVSGLRYRYRLEYFTT